MNRRRGLARGKNWGMDLNLVRTSTYKVLSKISENEDELNTVTLPVLREKVAEAMELPIEDLLGKEIKAVILETFQDFLLSKNDKKVGDQVEEDEPKVEDKPATKKPKKDTEMKKKEDKTEKKTSSEASSKTKVDKVEVKYTSKLKSPSPSATSTKNSQIERLKSYVFKCGVRKNWKKELDGLNEKQSIAKIQGILRELGIEGKPSLEQCKAIKARREFEAELREIDTSNIIEGKRRNRGSSDINIRSSGLRDTSINTKRKIITSDESESADESDDESEKGFEVDLKVFGDSESD